jgi:hypothetical protein
LSPQRARTCLQGSWNCLSTADICMTDSKGSWARPELGTNLFTYWASVSLSVR